MGQPKGRAIPSLEHHPNSTLRADQPDARPEHRRRLKQMRLRKRGVERAIVGSSRGNGGSNNDEQKIRPSCMPRLARIRNNKGRREREAMPSWTIRCHGAERALYRLPSGVTQISAHSDFFARQCAKRKAVSAVLRMAAAKGDLAARVLEATGSSDHREGSRPCPASSVVLLGHDTSCSTWFPQQRPTSQTPRPAQGLQHAFVFVQALRAQERNDRRPAPPCLGAQAPHELRALGAPWRGACSVGWVCCDKGGVHDGGARSPRRVAVSTWSQGLRRPHGLHGLRPRTPATT